MAFEPWTRRAIECSESSGLFGGSLEDKTVEKNADDGAWLMK